MNRFVIFVLVVAGALAVSWWVGVSSGVGSDVTQVGPEEIEAGSNVAVESQETDAESTTNTGSRQTVGAAESGSPSAQQSGIGGEAYTLLPTWQAKYEGQCTDCHIPNAERDAFHPMNRQPQLQIDTWFYDDDQQTGPNLHLDNLQPSGFEVDGQVLYCSDCHTATHPGKLATNESGRTGDPHSVHQAVYERTGCDRCHGPSASQDTEGVHSPLDMTRDFDGKFLATREEAAYADENGSTEGFGYTKYLHSDSEDVVIGSCGDCHGLYHGEGGFAFSFDQTPSSGPQTPTVGGTGLLVNQTAQDCGTCHVQDVHAVHTNGKMNSRVDFEKAMNLSRSIRLEDSEGAETCLECHGAEIVQSTGGSHWELSTARRLGLLGDRDGPPDSSILTAESADCSYCHQ